MEYGAFCVICPRASSQYVTPLILPHWVVHTSTQYGTVVQWSDMILPHWVVQCTHALSMARWCNGQT